MSKLLSINARPGEGLALLTVREFGDVYSGQLWSKCKARKHGVCDASGDWQQPLRVWPARARSPGGGSFRRPARVQKPTS